MNTNDQETRERTAEGTTSIQTSTVADAMAILWLISAAFTDFNKNTGENYFHCTFHFTFITFIYFFIEVFIYFKLP